MNESSNGPSYYFFDFDDNLMFLSTSILLLNTVTRQERAVSTRQFPDIQPLLGRPGVWEDYDTYDSSFRNFRDITPEEVDEGIDQPFVSDIRAALTSGNFQWQGPSWKYFVYACKQKRPVSIVTARGHSRETVRAGIKLFVEKGFIPHEPCYHTIYAVGNTDIRRELGDADLMMTTPALKRRAIIESVEQAIIASPGNPDLRFGMSDDDPQNISLIVRAMCECKKRNPDKRFFVINTHMDEEVKLEVFPMGTPVTGQPKISANDLLTESGS